MIITRFNVFRKWILIFSLIASGLFPLAAAADYKTILPDKIKYPSLKFDLPKVERISLENGIILYILEDHELPVVNINALVKTGTMFDPVGKEGLADLTAHVMKTGGSQKHGSSEIDKQFDSLAASPFIKISVDNAQIDFSVLNNDIDQGLNLLSQILIMPAFEQKKYELAKELQIEDLRRLKDDPQRLAFREFSRIIFRDNPRSRNSSVKSLNNITRDDLIEFHNLFFQPKNIMFAITGDISKEEAIKKIRHYFGNWQSSGGVKSTPPPPQHSEAGFYFIDKKIPQSTIITGDFAPGKTNPDFYAFTLLDFIIGSGGFPSRIFSAVRNNEGLAYSAGSIYRPRGEYGFFAAYAFTKTDSTFKTLSLIDSVLNRAKVNSITSKEIDWAKKSINNGFIFSFTSAEKIAWLQMKVEYEHLPAGYLTSYRKKIENVNAAQINNAAVKYLDKNNHLVLILGDSKNFGPILKDYNQPVLIVPQD